MLHAVQSNLIAIDDHEKQLWRVSRAVGVFQCTRTTRTTFQYSLVYLGSVRVPDISVSVV
jgi:hypothetical protein